MTVPPVAIKAAAADWDFVERWARPAFAAAFGAARVPAGSIPYAARLFGGTAWALPGACTRPLTALATVLNRLTPIVFCMAFVCARRGRLTAERGPAQEQEQTFVDFIAVMDAAGTAEGGGGGGGGRGRSRCS